MPDPTVISRSSRVEFVIMLIIVGVLIALVLPRARWVGSGDSRIPVRAVVFDATDGTAIAGARVGLFRALAIRGGADLEANREEFAAASRGELFPDWQGTTGGNGEVVIEFRFDHSSSDSHPVSRIHANRAWMLVEADDYGSVLIPVSAAAVAPDTIRNEGEIVVPVGLRSTL